MFSIDTTINDLKSKERSLHKVLFSLNIHEVATPELSADYAKSYVFFFRDGGKYSAYIGLYFPHSDRKLYYGYSANPFSESDLPDVEDEARNFTEDMGAMLDELHFSKLSEAERDRWINEQDIFAIKKKEEEPTAVDPAESTPPAEQTTSVVVQPTSATKESSEPKEKAEPIEQAPNTQPMTAVSPIAAPPIAPAPPAESVSAAVEQPPVQTKGKLPESPSRSQTNQIPAVVANEAGNRVVSGAAIKATKHTVSKNSGDVPGIAGRDKEVLARLLASF